MSPEGLESIRRFRSTWVISDYHRKRIIESNSTRVVSDVHRENLSMAVSTSGSFVSQSTRDKLSVANKGRPVSGVTRRKIAMGNKRPDIPVVQISFDGCVIRTFTSHRKVSEFGFVTSCVLCCCLGTARTHKGYKFKFENESSFKYFTV